MQTLKLDFNERGDKVSPLAKDARFGANLWKYPEREFLEAKIAEVNQLQASQVLCCNGGDEAIMILMRILSEGKKMILPLPAFSQYLWGVESWSLDAELIPALKDLAINLDATISAMKSTTNAVTIITRPNNPTGEYISTDSLMKLLAVAKESNSWVFLDEAYIEFSDVPTSPESLLSQYSNLILLRTFSKAFGLAGIRCGYIMGANEIIEQFRRRCMPFNVPQPCLEIAAQALSKDNRQEVKNYCKVIQNNRQFIQSWLQKNAIPALPSQANFVLLQLPDGQAQATASFLKKQGILVKLFDVAELTNCLRITIPYEIERLLDLLKQCLTPQLICLDMDGVLIDTSGSYDATVAETVKQLSGKEVTRSEIYALRDSGGFNNDWVLSQRLLTNLGKPTTLEEVTEIFQRIYLGESNDGMVSNERCLINRDLVGQLNKLAQTKLAIVTGRPRNEANAGAALVGINPDAIVSLDDVKEAKPSPEGIQAIQKKFSSFSWMCGDNPDDMQAANASNSLAIGIGARNAESLYSAGADIVLEDINQLQDWVANL